MVNTILGMMGASHKATATAQADYAKRDMANAAANETLRQLGMARTAAQTNEASQLGSVRASYGASGVTMSGSAVDTMNSQAGILNAKISQMTDAGVFEANQKRAEANIYNQAGENALSMGQIEEGQQAFGGWLRDASMMAG